MKKIFSFLFAALVLWSTTAQAADTHKFAYDPAHTQVMFSVSHLGYSFSHGRFTKFSGGFAFDEAQPEKSVADMTIETNSLVMDSEAWEKHLKNEDFFNVEKFPTMAFKTTKVVKTGDKTAQVTGDFTLLGVTKPITLEVTLNNSGIHPYSKSYAAGFSATGTIKRSDFGMEYGLPGVGDDVSLNIQVEGIRQDAEKLKQ